MKNIKKITGKLEILKRLNRSINGNPRFLLSVGNVECCTAPDSSLSYMITNFDGRSVVADIGEHYGKLTINYLTAI